MPKLITPWSKVLLIVSALLAVGMGIWWARRFNTTPSLGHTVPSQPAPVIPLDASNSATQSFTGTYIHFDYPSSYRQVPIKLTGDRIEVADLIGLKGSNKELTASVLKASLADNSDIKLRRNAQDLYNEESLAVDGKSGLIFTKKHNGFEKSVFTEHNGLLLTMTLRDSSSQDHSKEFDNILESLKWQ